MPFLDIELVDFVRRIPHQYKYRNGETKYLLKKSLEKYCRMMCCYRPKKGFWNAGRQWFKEEELVLNNSPSDYLSSEYSNRRKTGTSREKLTTGHFCGTGGFFRVE